MNNKFGRLGLWLAVGAAAVALGCGEQTSTETETDTAPSAQTTEPSTAPATPSEPGKGVLTPLKSETVTPAQRCQQEIQAEDKTPPQLSRVTDVQDNASFLKRVLAKAPAGQPAQATAPAAVPAAYIFRQQQYLAQAQALDAVADPAEREARRAALKQSILPVGKE